MTLLTLMGIGGGLAVLVALGRQRAAIRRHQHQLELQVPDLVDLVVVGLLAGATPARAVLDAAPWLPAPIGVVLGETAHQVERGAPVLDALGGCRDRLGPAAAPVLDALLAAERDGLPAAPLLDRLGDEARQQRRRLADADARRLPIQLTFPLVCCTLPSFVLLGIVPVLAGTLSELRAALP